MGLCASMLCNLQHMSVEKHVSTNIFAKLKTCTNTYKSLQFFTAEINSQVHTQLSVVLVPAGHVCMRLHELTLN